jgi:hypothetical protein
MPAGRVLRPLPCEGNLVARDRRGGWLVTAMPARAVVFGGGGNSRSDCLLVFDGPLNDPPTHDRATAAR